MRIWRSHELGDPLDVLRLEDDDAPGEPGPSQVLIDTAAVGLTFPDVLSCRGEYQVPTRLPYTPGGAPVIIGGGGPRMLGVAAEHADIVAITANLRAGAVGEDAIADSMPEAYDRKIARVKEVAGDRFDSMEINSLAMNTSITDDRDGALEFFAQIFNAPKEVVAQSPALIAGSVGEIVETLQERRDRWGFNYVVVQQNGGQGMEQFSEVIAALAGT